MEKKFLRKLTMVTLIVVLFVLNVLMFTVQIANAEESSIDADPILEGVLEKYINYHISDEDKGTLIQYHLRTGINYKEESEVFPVKENETTIRMGQIDGQYPYDVKVIMNSTKTTNGNIDSHNTDVIYNPEMGVVKINIHNQDENGNMISDKIPSSDSRDDYVLICYYHTYVDNSVEREVSLNISSKMTLFTDENKEVHAEGELKNTVTENIGELTSIKHDTEDIYNGYMKSNVINGTEYNTQYADTIEVNVSKKEAHKKIQLTEENTFVRTNDEEIIEELGNDNQLIYRSTKLEKQNIVELLGEEFNIEISDENGNILATINNDTEVAEDGSFTVIYENDVKNLNIKTSDIISEGTLYIENTKEIKSTMRDIENVNIKTTTNIIGLNEEVVSTEEDSEENEIVEKEVYTNGKEDIITIQEANNNVDINVSSSDWTNKQQNEVTFDIHLNGTSSQFNLFKNPQLKIELPSQVEKVILGNSSIVYGNGLELQEPYVETDEDGNFSIVANLVGEQTQYTEKDLELITDIKIPATIILKKDIQNVLDKINFVYTNAYTLNGQVEENNIQKDIKIQSYNQEESATTVQDVVNTLIAQQNTDSLNVQVTAKKGDTTLNDNDIVYEGEYIKYSVRVTNITDMTLNDVKVVGSVPHGVTYGELEADYYSYNGEYKYNFDDNVTEKTINVGTLESGKTIEVFYEVQVDDLAEGEEQKEITTNIKSYVGDAEASNWELTNVVNSSSATIFVDARHDNGINRWNYNVYLKGEEGKEVTVQIKLPEAFTPTHLAYDGLLQDVIPSENITLSEDNVLTAKLKIANGMGYAFEGDMDESKIDKNTDELGTTLIATSSVSVDGNTYYANETRIFYEFTNASISMTSPTEGQEIAYEDEIEYDIVVQNTGGSNYNNEDYKSVSVRLTDYLPEDVNPISVTYENYEPHTELVTDENGVTTTHIEYEKKEETLDISSISTDPDGNRLPNVDITLLIPAQEKVNIKIIATAGYVYEKTKIENNATIISESQGQEESEEGSTTTSVITLNKTSNTISHTILPANNENTEDPDNPDNPDNPDPENPEDPDNPNPDDPNNPNPGEGNYSISGVAWVDENEDGERQSTEQLLSGITVMLLDTQNANTVEAQKETDSNGAYNFTDLESGQYIVIFRYDTNNYELTEYRKNGISDNVNCDVSSQEMTIGGERVLVGATDILALQNNMSNVDMGLIENKFYDLRLDKFISQVTAETNQRTSVYGYENGELAKVDIRAKEIEGAKVTVEYKIIVTNEGEISANANSVVDYLPDGFVLAENTTQNWMKQTDGTYINTNIRNQKIDPGQSVTLTLTATKTMSENNTGIFINKAEIQEAGTTTGREDIDSTPGNKVETEDDFSKAEIIISIGTGIGVYISIGTILAVLVTIGIIIGGKKGKIKIGKISKITMFIMLFMIMLYVQTPLSLSVGSITDYLPEHTQWNFDGDAYNNGEGSYFDNVGDGLPRGECIDYGVHNADMSPPYNRNYTLDKDASSVTVTYRSTPVKTGSITLTKGNSNITMKQLDNNNYLLGPFVIKCNNNNGYTIQVKDSKGNNISGVSTCDSSGKSMTVKGNATFYIKISAANCANGISKVVLSNSAQVSAKSSIKVKAYGVYNPDKGSEYQRVAVTVYRDDEETTTTTDTKSVEWKDINGALEIVKQDADNANIKLSGVQIRVQNSTVGYDKTFTTDANGKIHIDNLQVGTYTITEVSNNNYGYSKVERGQVTVYSGRIAAFTLPNEKQTGNLKIYKKDADNDTIALPGVSFKIRNSSGQYIIGVDANGETISKATGTVHLSDLQTTTNINNATEFITDSNGCIQIYNLLIDTYIVSEISVGDNFGYDVDSSFISWESNGAIGSGNTATITITRQTSGNTGSSSSVGDNASDVLTIKNKRKYIKISGYAWEDKTDGKGSQKDYQWTDGTEDRRLQYITVTLKNADGIVLDTRVTNANGEYKFGNYDEDSSAIKLEIDELPGAYIEFEYNGMSYQSIPINSEFGMISATNTGGLNTANIISGTKNSATDEALRDAFNHNYATIRKGISQNTQDQKVYDIQYTYSDYKSTVVYGDSVNYGYEGQRYPISGVYDQYEITAVTNANANNALCTQYTTQDIRQNSVLEIAGINLGVEEREMPDLNLSKQDLEKMEVQLNDYTHTYKYGQVSADPDGFAGGDVSNIAVRFASKYFESSYTREIYTADVVYNKQAGNEGKLKMYMTYKIEITNEATSLNSTAKTIANYYDARYENIVVTDENGNTIDYQIDDSYNVNGLKKMEIYVNQQLAAQTSKTITIRYQLNNDAINALLNGETTLDSISEITGYSTYMDNTFTTPYAGIDVDSAPDTVIPGDRSTYEDDTNWAPSLILVLKEGRIIQGTVWEDAPIEDLLEGTGYDKQRIGDGQYQSSENIVNNVKVDLMLIDESGNLTLAKLYKRDETVVDATTTTSGKGEYSFVGVEPGNYVIRYTYGDNSVICDAEGNEIKNVDADIYKSTIYRGGNKDAVNSMTDYWYRGETSHEGAIRLSDAKDNEEFVNDRITEEEVNYETVTDRMQLTEISADTRKFDIKLDYDINLDNISEYGVDLKFVFDNIDFGIIERPRQSLQIDKEIGYLQLTLANGVNTINGDPRSQNLSGVVALPDGNIHIEVDNEIIQGATLKVTYEITVDNSNCEIDYNDEDYYIYGTVPANKEEVFKIATVVDMFDYLPEDVVLESTDGNNWERITISEDMKGTLLQNEVYDVVRNLQNVIHLKNPVFENMQPGSEAVDTSMVVTKQLSVSSDDLVYENDVEVVKLKGRKTIDSIPGNYDPTTNTPDEYDDDRVELTITGPTGENRQYIIYGAIGIGMLVIVGIGIVIIKRKILKK